MECPYCGGEAYQFEDDTYDIFNMNWDWWYECNQCKRSFILRNKIEIAETELLNDDMTPIQEGEVE
jgi:DNA-directed RNA polymerase subunit RPC12/RpoP